MKFSGFAVICLLAIACMMVGCAPAWAHEVASSDAPKALVEQAKWTAQAASIVAFCVQLLKSDILGGLMAKVDKRLQPAMVVLLGQIAALIQSVASGKSLAAAAIEWAFVSGGAMTIYMLVIKPFTEKKKPEVAA